MSQETTTTASPSHSEAPASTAPTNAHPAPASASEANVAAPAPVDDKAAKRAERSSKAILAAAREKRKAQELAKKAEAERAELEAFKAAREKLKQDPLAVLRAEGISERDLVARLINPPADPDEMTPEERRLAAIEAKLAEKEKREQEERERAEQEYIERNIGAYKSQVAELVKAGGERFELNALDGDDVVDKVWAIVEHKFNQEGVLMSPEEALQLREDWLLHQEKQRAGKSKKLAALWNSKGSEQGSNEDKDIAGRDTTAGGTRGDTRPPVVRTLTNSRSSSVTPRESSWDGYELTREAAIQRALEKAGLSKR